MTRKPMKISCVLFLVTAAALFVDVLAQPVPPNWNVEDVFRKEAECLSQNPRSVPDRRKCRLAKAAALPPLDSAWREWFGEFYDPKAYAKKHEKTASPEDAQYEYLTLVRFPEPEYWPNLPAPTVKWPEAPNPPTYQSGMTREEYYKALCKFEAGEFVYRVVAEVDGLYQIRPRKPASGQALRDRYVMEDPYGYTNLESTEPGFVFVGRNKYTFLEVPARTAVIPDSGRGYRDPSMFASADSNSSVARYWGYDSQDMKTLKRAFDPSLKARYGYLWRGISRPNDRNLGIAGGELAVVDLQSGEILGLRRGFIVSGKVRNTRSGFQWEIGAACPANAAAPGLHKSDHFSYSFISKVLQPRRQAKGE